MRFLILCTFFLCALTPVSQAVNFQGQSTASIPAWLAEFSNLESKKRIEYIENFNKAKIAYAESNWHICLAYLSECEFIYNKNPHVRNLRASCLIALKNYDEAEEEINKAKEHLPNDETTIMNCANLHLAKKEYAQCIVLIKGILDKLPYEEGATLPDVLTFRIYLCHLMLGQEKEAQELVRELNPMSDTPLYYYSQAALHISKGNAALARQDIMAAEAIFYAGNATLPYQQAIQATGLEEKFLPAKN